MLFCKIRRSTKWTLKVVLFGLLLIQAVGIYLYILSFSHQPLIIPTIRRSTNGTYQDFSHDAKILAVSRPFQFPQVHDDKFVFVLRYYEQLTMATKNLLSLASLAAHSGRYVVMPFVGNSRFCGSKNGVLLQHSQPRLPVECMSVSRKSKFVDFSAYFDVSHFNSLLKLHGYSQLAGYSDFFRSCYQEGMGVVAYFLYNTSTLVNDTAKMFHISALQAGYAVDSARRNQFGWTNCDFIRNMGFEKLLGEMTVKSYICIDPEIVMSPEKLEKNIFMGSKCVGIINWKGNGYTRTHFPHPYQITHPLRPSNFRHASRLMDIVYQYIKNKIQGPYVSVHARAERLLRLQSLEFMKSCVRTLATDVMKAKQHSNVQHVFLATDLHVCGSGTIRKYLTEDQRVSLLADVRDSFHKPIFLLPKDYGLYDRGEIAIVEMHILSLGKALFTIGGGNYQNWVTDLFMLHQPGNTSSLYRIC